MFEFIRDHQLNIMLALCAVCLAMAGFLVVTKYLSAKRKWILIFMELLATLLLSFDRAAYLYKDVNTDTAYVMVRVSNLMVFFLTSAIVFGFNLYLTDLLLNEGGLKEAPARLKVVNILAFIGMGLAVISHFTGLYYYFDENNVYHRGPGFLICYIVPILGPVIQYTVIHKYRKSFSKLIYISLVLYLAVPIAMGIIQIFTYGISIVNMAMVLVSISLYVFTYLDINAEAVKSHRSEIVKLEEERTSARMLFDETVKTFVNAMEKKDIYSQGHSLRVAQTAWDIAKEAGLDETGCVEAYYSAMLHNIGMLTIPDTIVMKPGRLNAEEAAIMKNRTVVGSEILTNIEGFPNLAKNVRYSDENFDGTGYPEGLAGDAIPEASRIIAVADNYDRWRNGRRGHAALPPPVIREELLKASGSRFDPRFTVAMIHLMDKEAQGKTGEAPVLEGELVCGKYRETISAGIPLIPQITEINFSAEEQGENAAPSIIIFDAYDARVHDNLNSIKEYKYEEYAEAWFDGHFISTNARNIKASTAVSERLAKGKYKITAGRFEDHLLIKMTSEGKIACFIVALPDNSKSAYIGITGENCHIKGLTAVRLNAEIKSIKKIVKKINYIDRIESDLPNIQIDHTRNKSTVGTLIEEELFMEFHSMSLPSSNLVWHCPYIVLFYSEDGKVGGKGYKEYALVKLCGEVSGEEEHAENHLSMQRNDSFAGWEEWKANNREGIECSVSISKKGNKIVLSSETLGIEINNETIISDKDTTCYAAITGDMVAITDIRIR
ncbi:MAG: HD domain-containing protein [Saccharofermentans sp.]|nr:HD domain-containing protein [Saccharofermentans sp.]